MDGLVLFLIAVVATAAFFTLVSYAAVLVLNFYLEDD